MKKYRITDADGCEYSVEEIEEKKIPDEETEVVTEAEKKTEKVEKVEKVELTEDEIKALKKLAAVADKLAELVAEDKDDDEEIEETEEVKEEIVDTDEEDKKKACDSKKSIGAIEKAKQVVDDSLEDDISTAWAKRYGGIK